ncbi:MAG: hypothetical protein KDC61_07070, partial [Saprospiraceae bacterium]|nr:hypothetical protein [Saprospiraceae bacterium]
MKKTIAALFNLSGDNLSRRLSGNMLARTCHVYLPVLRGYIPLLIDPRPSFRFCLSYILGLNLMGLVR